MEFWKFKISLYLCTAIPKGLAQYEAGAIAQLVEQRTENPCVPGSIPGGTTQKATYESRSLFCCLGRKVLQQIVIFVLLKTFITGTYYEHFQRLQRGY